VQPVSILLPLPLPDTKSLRRAGAAIIRDIQLRHHETDQDTADRLGVSRGTISNVRNELSDPGALLIAKVGRVYGREAIAPYSALVDSDATDGVAEPTAELGEAVSALARARAKGTKGRLDALPAVKAAIEAASAYVASVERERLRLVS
jgi:transcriptional regulator with XRE-family HTH domain